MHIHCHYKGFQLAYRSTIQEVYHTSVPYRCTIQVYHTGVPYRCTIQVHTGVPYAYRSIQVYHTGVPYRSIQVYHTGPYRCTIQVYHTGVPYRCTIQVYHTGIPYRCTIQVYHTGVPYRVVRKCNEISFIQQHVYITTHEFCTYSNAPTTQPVSHYQYHPLLWVADRQTCGELAMHEGTTVHDGVMIILPFDHMVTQKPCRHYGNVIHITILQSHNTNLTIPNA